MEQLEKIGQNIRKYIMKTAHRGGTGHIASAMSVADIVTILYFGGILNYDKKNPEWAKRDKLIMSKGHASLALYSAFTLIGYLREEELCTFCQPGSLIGGEPKYGDIPGIEATTGSLGHGLSFGVGIAMANKMNANPGRVYVILGDGECQEGSVWEAVLGAAHHKLSNLVVILDHNKLQAMDEVENIVSLHSLTDKFKTFGWDVQEVDGHNYSELLQVLQDEKDNTIEKPRMILANTIKGKGVSLMEQVPIWHYRMPNEIELESVLRDLEIGKEELNL